LIHIPFTNALQHAFPGFKKGLIGNLRWYLTLKVVGLSPEDRTQKRKIKSEEIHRKIKSKWTNREIAK
jgi:hypothetical protein